MYDEFESRDVLVVAIAQEDTDLESHGKFLKHFDPAPRFEIVADLSREASTGYDRTTTYLIDDEGVVRQVFPQLIHHRAAWPVILDEVRRQLDDAPATRPAPEP